MPRKYQWQAWHEALARLADTHLLQKHPERHPVTAHTSPPPQLNPSHPLTGNLDHPEDDYAAGDSPWWLPLPAPQTPDLSSFDLQYTWVVTQAALLDTSELVVIPGAIAAASPTGRTLELRDSGEWILLHSTVVWYWDANGRFRACPARASGQPTPPCSTPS
ncbi:hypothetical protein ACFYOT_35255 [Saccharothrix saharensis]|uniref:hypothetical protein n=1 Tax=Saccharothrix saharensis TaxID=571190 RepID=UPI003677987B